MKRQALSPERFEQILASIRQNRDSESSESSDDGHGRWPKDRPRNDDSDALVDRTFSAEELTARISEWVLHQPQAVRATADVLAVRTGVARLYPERPLAFLLATGPTGTGKTTLASAIADVVYGNAEQVLTIDCSELSTPASVSGLIGPPPGYVGYSERDSWLTTRMSKLDRGVILFDEIEKADREIHNLLLQIGEGHLTDTTGTSVSFSDYTILLTSNTGASEAGRNPVGFRARRDTGAEVRSAVSRAFAPELLSRIDATLMFEQLPDNATTDIAWRIWAEFCDRVNTRGWTLKLDRELLKKAVGEVDLRAKGARELGRKIETRVLAGLNGLEPGSYHAELVGEHIGWVQDHDAGTR